MPPYNTPALYNRSSLMPLYEYQCKKCKHRFEKIRQFSDPPLKKCPECGGAVEQLLSAPAVQFKGSGWYVTDYARKPEGGSAKSSGDSGTSGDSGGDDSSASKAVEKTASDDKGEHKEKKGTAKKKH
jgi:putative FmdB family regulatory protein